MELAQITVCGNNVRLHAGVGAQPVADQLVDAAVNAVEGGLGQQPHLRRGEKLQQMRVDRILVAGNLGM